MEKELRFSYDREADILDVSVGDEQEAGSQELEDDFFVRILPGTKEIVGLSILNFEKWFKDKKGTKSVPVSAKFELVAA